MAAGHFDSEFANGAMTTIFISYRRDDAAAYAGRLYDGLRGRYGEHHVFMDVDRIQPGENFAVVIERSVRNAEVVLAVIGPQWLTITGGANQRRLDDPDDFVRLEIKAALDTQRRVIPVLVDNAKMPDAEQLPPPLKRLAGLHAVPLSDERWDYDTARLMRAIDGTDSRGSQRKWLWGAAACVLAAAPLGWYVATQRPAAPQPARVNLRAAAADVSVDQARALVIQRNFFHAQWNAAAPAAQLELTREARGTAIVVSDLRHQRMWQHSASPTTLHREAAQAYVRELNAGRFAGYSDWRLPTLEEALMLMSVAPADGCRLPQAFDRTALVMLTADSVGSERDWIVYFCNGIAAAERAGFSAQVRAVRTLP